MSKTKALVVGVGRRKSDGKPFATICFWSDKAGHFCLSRRPDGSFDFGFIWLSDEKYDEYSAKFKNGLVIEYDRPDYPVVE